MNRVCIKSYAFFDLETTGLPDIEFNKTKITEICLVATSRDNMMNTETNRLPRVLHKLSFCVNPFKQISSESTRLTGLDNFMLENENKFDENFVGLLSHFLLQLPQPVCLVAHNGDKFDFPIMQRQLNALNMNLPDDLRCIDSLLFFRWYEDYLEQEKLEQPMPLPDENNIKKKSREDAPLTREDDLRIHGAVPSNEVQLQNDIVQPSTSSDLLSDFELDINSVLAAEDVKQKQKVNESTPSNRKAFTKKELFSTKLLNCGSSDSVTPPHPKRPRQLFTPEKCNPVIGPSKRMKFTLTAVHERLFGKAPNSSHYAENDVLALLKCAVATKMEFIEYAEGNAKYFKDIKPIGM